MSSHVTYASKDLSILEMAFQLFQGTRLRMPFIDTGSESTTLWDRFSQKIHAVGAMLCTSTYSSPGARKDTPNSYSLGDHPMCEIH